MEPTELRMHWRRWVEKEIGGPEGRIEIATQAAMAAIAQRQSVDLIVASARQAAASWGHTPSRAAAPAQSQVLPPPPGPPASIVLPVSDDFRYTPHAKPSSSMVPLDRSERRPRSVWLTLLTVLLGLIIVGAFYGASAYLLDFLQVFLRWKELNSGTLNILTSAVLLVAIGLAAIWALVRSWRPKRPSARYAVNTVGKPDDQGKVVYVGDVSSQHPGIVRGRVGGLQQRQQSSRGFGVPYELVWNFRIERRGLDGTLLSPVAVEMKGVGFSGAISNGDEVEVAVPDHKAGQIVSPRQILNLSSNSVVRSLGIKASFRAMRFAFLVFWITALVFIVSMFIFIASKGFK